MLTRNHCAPLQRGEITLEEAAAAGNTPAPGADASASPSGAAASPGAAAGDAAAASPAIGKSPLGAAPGPPPTPFVAVNGMITAEVLADDTEYEEVGYGSAAFEIVLLDIGVLQLERCQPGLQLLLLCCCSSVGCRGFLLHVHLTCSLYVL